jgi:hypothetical protein
MGLGAILYQKQEKKLKVIGYASRSLNGAEKNYHSSKLEFLALKWAVTEKFKPYLYYASHIDIYTDNNPLTYINTSAKLTATGQRWVNELADYRMQIHYRKGTQNIDADYLSRYPLNLKEFITECEEKVEKTEMKALLEGIQVKQITTKSQPINTILLPPLNDLPSILEEQKKDETICIVTKYIKTGTRPLKKERRGESIEVAKLMAEWNNLIVSNEGIC